MQRENFNNPKRVSTYQPSNERKRRGGKKNGGNSRGGRRIEGEEKRRKVAAKETRKKEKIDGYHLLTGMDVSRHDGKRLGIIHIHPWMDRAVR